MRTAEVDAAERRGRVSRPKRPDSIGVLPGFARMR